MLSDHFPPERLARPVSGFLLSAPVGQGLAYIGGGSLLAWLSASRALRTGALSGFEPWQLAFLIIGAPGLLLVPFFFLIPEPKRLGTGAAAPLDKREVMAVVANRWKALVPMFCGFAIVLLVAYSYPIWTPALFERTFHWRADQIGLAYGAILIIFGTSGVFVAGLLSDWLAAQGHAHAPLKVAAGGFAVCGVSGTLAPLMPTPALALGFLAITTFCGNMPFPCAAASLQFIVPNRARAQVTALYVTFTTLVGLILGPLVVGIMTDFVFRDPSQIRYSLSVVVAVASPVMVLMMRIAMPGYLAASLAAGEQARGDDCL